MAFTFPKMVVILENYSATINCICLFVYNITFISFLLSESLQSELVKCGAIPIFYNCLKSFISKESEMTGIVLGVLSGLAANGM